MANKKKYYDLDEIGFVGVQDKMTKSHVKGEIESTIQFIKKKKAVKKFSKASTEEKK